jgi:hypothetical protein
MTLYLMLIAAFIFASADIVKRMIYWVIAEELPRLTRMVGLFLFSFAMWMGLTVLLAGLCYGFGNASSRIADNSLPMALPVLSLLASSIVFVYHFYIYRFSRAQHREYELEEQMDSIADHAYHGDEYYDDED